MAKARAKVKVDVSELSEWADELRQLAEKEYQEFLLQAARMLATEFIQRAKAKDRTPIGEYPAMIEFTTRAGKKVSFENPLKGMHGGKLRDSWKVGSTRLVKGGVEVEIYNDAGSESGESYASHVEFGHRKMNKKGGEVKGFVRGKKMMAHTEIEMVFVSEELLEKEFEQFLKEKGI